MKKSTLILFSVLGGLLLSLAWPEKGFAPLLFIGFVPFLFIEDHILKNPVKFGRISVFLFVYPGFLAWNILTTWWIWNSTITGAILAWVLNALMMSFTFQLFHFTRKYITARNLALA
jgi:apolipoprotein N-acyltransferase